MELDFNSEKPIFQQIAEGLEDSILSGAFPEESQIPSITEFSVLYKINPATALKGINLLVGRRGGLQEKGSWYVCGTGCGGGPPRQTERRVLRPFCSLDDRRGQTPGGFLGKSFNGSLTGDLPKRKRRRLYEHRHQPGEQKLRPRCRLCKM